MVGFFGIFAEFSAGVLLIGGVWLLLLENVCQFRVVLAVRRRRRIHERLGFALRFVYLNALLLQL